MSSNSVPNKYFNCQFCMYADRCDRECNCEYVTPSNDAEFGEAIVRYLRKLVPYSGEPFMRKGRRASDAYDDGISPTYQYYCGMINDCLRTIRHGGTAYLYYPDQIKDVLRHEEEIHVTWHDGVYYITK